VVDRLRHDAGAATPFKLARRPSPDGSASNLSRYPRGDKGRSKIGRFVPNRVRLRIAILRNLRPHAIQEWI